VRKIIAFYQESKAAPWRLATSPDFGLHKSYIMDGSKMLASIVTPSFIPQINGASVESA
jgi:hypothetical protein